MMIFNNLQKNLTIFLIFIFPLTLITGPLIPEIIVFLIIVIFLKDVIYIKNYTIFKNFYFIYFGLFIIYLIFISLISDFKDQILFKNLFFFRFFLFVFSIYYFFQIKEIFIKSLFFSLNLVFLLLIFDGFYQYFFDQNTLGYPQLRPDRVSSFFGDRLVLGSYLSKFIFIYLGLYLYLKNKMKNYQAIIHLCLVFFTFITIIISGDRAALFITLIGFILLFLLLNINIKKKIIIFFSIFSCLTAIFSLNEKIFDRYIHQTVDQFNIFSIEKNQSFFENIKYYSLTWQTSNKAFLDKKIFGQGPKTFRIYCSDERFKTLSNELSKERNDLVTFKVHKKYMNVRITDIYVKNGDKIDLGTDILVFEHRDRLFNFVSKKKGIVNKLQININDIIDPGHLIFHLDLSGSNIKPTTFFYKDGCTTHPHQVYLQLLSETGIIGFLFIFLCFIYSIVCIIRFIYLKLFKKIIIYSDFQLCIIVNLSLYLFPITTSGNFFNNWYIMLHLIQISVSLYAFKNNEKKSMDIKNN